MPSFVWLIKHIAISVAAVALMTDASWASLTEQTRHTSESESPAVPIEKPAPAQSQSGTVRIKFVKAGLIVGVGSGSGTLTFRGKTFPLSIGGVDIGSVGISTVQMTGTANNLNSASDIAGRYGAGGSSATIGGGNRVATIQNEKGVVLRLRGSSTGLQASLGLSGMTITLRQANASLRR